nr:MFS transporter [Sulfobacillus harzensis]
MLIGTIDYMDRSTLSIGNPLIRSSLHLSVAQMGVLLSAFSWSYALAQLPAGGFVDRVGPRRLIAVGMTIWSLAQAASGFVVGLGQFIFARIFLGIGEAPVWPGGARSVNSWHKVRERGRPIGIFNSASTLGPAIASPILTAIMLGIGWRGMFIVMAVLGFIVAAIWYFVYRNPQETQIDTVDQIELRKGDTQETSQVRFIQWLRMFRYKETWGMIFGFFGTVYLLWLYITWLPGYLELARHESIAATGLLSSIPFALGFVGSIVGGLVSDWFAKRGVSPIASRKYPLVAGLFGMAVFTVPAALVHSAVWAVVFISLAEFFGNISSATAWALPTAVAPPNYVASLGGMQNFGGYFGASLAPVVTGLLVAASGGSFVSALIVGALVAVASALVYAILVRKPISGEGLEVPLTRAANHI